MDKEILSNHFLDLGLRKVNSSWNNRKYCLILQIALSSQLESLRCARQERGKLITSLSFMISAAFFNIFWDGGWFIRKGKYCHGLQWYVKRNCYFRVKRCQTKFTPLMKRPVKAPMWARNAKSGLQKPTSSCRALVMPSGLEISGDFLIFVTRTEEVILLCLKYTRLRIVFKVTRWLKHRVSQKNLSEFFGLQMKSLTECDLSNESYWAVLSVARLMILTFESVDEILKCDKSSESFWAILSCGAIYYPAEVGSYFWDRRWNLKVWPSN